MTIKELREQRKKLHEDASAILKAAKDAGRSMTSEEQEKFDAIYTDVDKIKSNIERMENHEAETRALEQPLGRRSDPSPDPHEGRAQPTEADRRAAFRAWALAPFSGRAASSDIEAAQRLGVNVLARTVVHEARALSAGVATTTAQAAGGYAVADEAMAALVEAQKYYGQVSQYAEPFLTATGAPLPIPTEDDTSNTGEIVAESGAVTTTADPTFGVVNLGSYMYSSKMVLVPVQLLQDASFNVAAYLGRKLGIRLERIWNTHFTTGDNSAKPQGIIAGATVGKTCSATNALTYSEIVDLVHSVDRAYRSMNPAFMMHDLIVAYARKLLDSTNRPLWEPSLQAGEPDRLLGYPLLINNDMASAVTTGLKVMGFGSVNEAYAVRKVQAVEFVRLDQLYMANLQVGFLAFQRADGRTKNAAAFKTMVLA